MQRTVSNIRFFGLNIAKIAGSFVTSKTISMQIQGNFGQGINLWAQWIRCVAFLSQNAYPSVEIVYFLCFRIPPVGQRRAVEFFLGLGR